MYISEAMQFKPIPSQIRYENCGVVESVVMKIPTDYTKWNK